MDHNQVYSECVTGNIEARKWWHRQWVKIIGISVAFLIIFAITLTLVLKFVILKPKQAEPQISSPATTITTSMTATTSLAILPPTSRQSVIISTTAIPQSTTEGSFHTTTMITATRLTTDTTVTSTIEAETVMATESPTLTTETTRTTTSIQQQININSKWKQNGVTVAGGNRAGNQLYQLSHPQGLYIDDDNQRIYIADWNNHRIVEWKYDAKTGQVVAGGNGSGNRTNQFYLTTGVTVDTYNHSMIVCDYINRRVVRWFYPTNINPQPVISNIDCFDVKLGKNGDLYVSDWAKPDVKLWEEKDLRGTVVAGGNGLGSSLKQLHYPNYIFVDQDYSVYVTDRENNRVMKWVKDAQEGIIAAGGYGKGSSLNQLSEPHGITVDRFGNIYVADSNNHRIMRWLVGTREGTIIVGGNGSGDKADQLNYPTGLSFDREGNLYVSDQRNHRVQKFDLIVE